MQEKYDEIHKKAEKWIDMKGRTETVEKVTVLFHVFLASLFSWGMYMNNTKHVRMKDFPVHPSNFAIPYD